MYFDIKIKTSTQENVPPKSTYLLGTIERKTRRPTGYVIKEKYHAPSSR